MGIDLPYSESLESIIMVSISRFAGFVDMLYQAAEAHNGETSLKLMHIADTGDSMLVSVKKEIQAAFDVVERDLGGLDIKHGDGRWEFLGVTNLEKLRDRADGILEANAQKGLKHARSA